MYVVNDQHIVSYSDIMNLINEGYKPLGDLRVALKEKLINDKHNNIKLYINNESKYIDIYANVLFRKSFDFGRWNEFYYFDDRRKVFYE